MTTLEKGLSEEQIIRKVVSNAKTGVWESPQPDEYFWSCRFWIEKYDALIIFSRDSGHHTCGWWKNPDYERCYHLSISFIDKFYNRKPHKQKTADKIVKMLYGNKSNLIWCEPPYSKAGIENQVWHYRLFCDENWMAIKPRGEVYSKKFTEIGWMSYSEKKNFES